MFVIVLSTMMIPGIVTMIPQYILYNVLGITDTFFIYVLGNIGGGAYNIFLFKQFFSAMPGELEEAAKIDGAAPCRPSSASSPRRPSRSSSSWPSARSRGPGATI